MTPCLFTVCLLVEAHEHRQGEVAEALQGAQRAKCANLLDLFDWAIAGDDIASSIAQITLLDDCAPDGTAFPLWPGRAL
jgi:hypothetical protein